MDMLAIAAGGLAAPDADSEADRLAPRLARGPQDLEILARPDPTSRRETQTFPATGDRPGTVGPSAAIRVTRHPPVALALSPLEPQQQCPLDDSPSCPRLSPQQLTPAEVEAIHDLATSHEYRHVPTGTLAILAQRLGKVFASASTLVSPDP